MLATALCIADSSTAEYNYVGYPSYPLNLDSKMTVTLHLPMTKDEVAVALRISKRYVEKLVNSGAMPACGRIGGRVFWHPEVFYAWLDNAMRPEPGAEKSAEKVDEMRFVKPFVLMTKAEVAAALRVSKRQVEKLVKSRAMPAPGHIGRLVFWHSEVFFAWRDSAMRPELGANKLAAKLDGSKSPGIAIAAPDHAHLAHSALVAKTAFRPERNYGQPIKAALPDHDGEVRPEPPVRRPATELELTQAQHFEILVQRPAGGQTKGSHTKRLKAR